MYLSAITGTWHLCGKPALSSASKRPWCPHCKDGRVGRRLN
jgi:hypothetical protein